MFPVGYRVFFRIWSFNLSNFLKRFKSLWIINKWFLNKISFTEGSIVPWRDLCCGYSHLFSIHLSQQNPLGPVRGFDLSPCTLTVGECHNVSWWFGLYHIVTSFCLYIDRFYVTLISTGDVPEEIGIQKPPMTFEHWYNRNTYFHKGRAVSWKVNGI